MSFKLKNDRLYIVLFKDIYIKSILIYQQIKKSSIRQDWLICWVKNVKNVLLPDLREDIFCHVMNYQICQDLYRKLNCGTSCQDLYRKLNVPQLQIKSQTFWRSYVIYRKTWWTYFSITIFSVVVDSRSYKRSLFEGIIRSSKFWFWCHPWKSIINCNNVLNTSFQNPPSNTSRINVNQFTYSSSSSNYVHLNIDLGFIACVI